MAEARRGRDSALDLVTLGLNAVDLLCEVDGYPAEDSKGALLGWRRLPGGQAATAAVTAVRLGMRAAYIGAVGDDENGRFARAELVRERVNVEGLRVRPGAESQCAVILVNRGNGSRTILWRRGAEIRVRRNEIDRALLGRARFFHCDGHNVGAEIAAARYCRGRGIPTSIDTEKGDPRLIKSLLEHIDHVVVPAACADHLRGRRCRTHRERMESLAAYGGRAVVLTLGSEGCTGREEGATVRVPAYPVRTVDTTGCGDVFHGAYIVAALRGLPLEPRLRFAAFVAALKCRAFGARTAIPTIGELRTRRARELGRWMGREETGMVLGGREAVGLAPGSRTG